MSTKLKGNNILGTSSTGLILDTVVSGKSINLKTNSTSRLLIDDNGVTFNIPLNGTIINGSFQLINTNTGPTVQLTKTNGQHIRVWGTTTPFTLYLPRADLYPVGSIIRILNTSTNEITIDKYNGGVQAVIYLPVNGYAEFMLVESTQQPPLDEEWHVINCTPSLLTSSENDVLMSNGPRDLPTYKQIWPANGSGTWTPALQCLQYLTGTYGTDTTYTFRNGTYFYSKIGPDTYHNVFNFRMDILTVGNVGVDNWAPAIRGIPWPCIQRTYINVYAVYSASSHFTVLATLHESGHVVNYSAHDAIGAYTYTTDGKGILLSVLDIGSGGDVYDNKIVQGQISFYSN